MTEEEADDKTALVAELCRGALEKMSASDKVELMLRGHRVYDEWLSKGQEETAVNVLHIAMQLLVRIAPKDKREFDRILSFFMYCFVRAYDTQREPAIAGDWPKEI